MCPKCNGYLVRDLGFQTVTHEGVAYHCVNCGNYIDLNILRNRQLTPTQRSANAHKIVKHGLGDDPDTLSGLGARLLARGLWA